ncbi:HEAT repeat domain-containing protein [Saccharibacillus kuerlensis]|uniref:HEAT repeat domain-containing protein n=1 Tax=Saccharibacillus kuerlensis TaxID=459527 RepID=A0ABQ2L1W7_9BACL|nr:HEAT repeat domain-containing protein [Saccharibacillus kuerlensis]GGN99891.1 hypothetical protein GCM10010969_20470 [Saccharibacillus kuerlensis]
MNDADILRILWIAAAVLILLIGLILFYLVERKVLRTRYRKQVAEAVDRLAAPDSPLVDYLMSGERSRRLAASGEGLRREALEEALLNRLTVSASQIERERIYDFAAYYFTEEYAYMLEQRRWSDRMNVLLHIEKFQMTGLKDKIIDRLDGLKEHPSHDDERFLLVRTLSSLQAKETFDYFDIAEKRFSELQLMQMLRPLQGELLDRLIHEFEWFPIRIRYCVLDTLRLGNVRTNEVLELLENCMRVEDREMRIRALKALANFGYITPAAADHLEARMIESETVSWPERLMHARLAGMLREERFVPHLETMMADPSYEVRREAASSLANYRNGLERIGRIAEEHPDRFARDMAIETLERRAYERNVG